MEEKKYNSVNHSVRKKDAMQLLLGKPVYVDDITEILALVVALIFFAAGYAEGGRICL